jgi:hypothetical protein
MGECIAKARLMQLDQALWGIYIPVDQPFGEGAHGWVEKGPIVEVIEPFNSSRQMTRQGRHVQRGLVSPSIANSRL